MTKRKYALKRFMAFTLSMTIVLSSNTTVLATQNPDENTVISAITGNELLEIEDTDTVDSIILNKDDISIYVGSSETLTATIICSDTEDKATPSDSEDKATPSDAKNKGTPSDAASKAVTWESNDDAVATVSSVGVVTGVSAGETTITVTTEDGQESAVCNVTVKDKLARLNDNWEKTVIFEADFDSYEVGKAPKGWGKSGNSQVTFTVEEREDGNNMLTAKGDAPTEKSGWLFAPFEQQSSGKVKFSIDVCVNADPGLGYMGVSTASIPGYAMQGVVDKNGGVGHHVPGLGNPIIEDLYTVGQWHTFVAILDCNSQRYDLYFDDELIYADTGLRQKTFERVLLGIGGNEYGGDVSFDNILVEAEKKEPIEAATLFEYDFEDSTAGELPKDWKTGGNGINNITFQVVEDDDGKYLNATAKDIVMASGWITAPAFAKQTTGKVSFSLDIRANDNNGLGYMGVSANPGLPDYTMQGAFDINGNVGHHVQGVGIVTQEDRYNAGQWHNYKVVLDCDSKRYDIYFDGELLYTDAKFRKDNFEKVTLGIGSRETKDTLGNFDFDNIVVETIVEVKEFEIKGGDRSVRLGEMRYLTYNNPDGYEGEAVFTSSNPEVATVTESGVLTTAALGETVITLDIGGNTTTVTITVKEDDTPEDFAKMKQRWMERIVLTDAVDADNEYVKAYIQKLSDSANEYWKTMNKNDGTPRLFLWDDMPDSSGGAAAKYSFRYMNTLAQAFVTEGTDLYMNEEVMFAIIDGLEFVTGTQSYRPNILSYDGTFPKTGNWHDWQIGSPAELNSLLIMLHKYLDDDVIKIYTKCMNGYAWDPNLQISVGGGSWQTNGANLLDGSMSVLGQGILNENPEQVRAVSKAVPKEMKVIKSYSKFGIDGMFEDGSYISHGRYAYNGGYGMDVLKGIGRISNLLIDTEYEIPMEDAGDFYNFCLSGFLPLLYNGKMMAMVDGRSISRFNSPGGMEAKIGNSIMGDMLSLAKYAPRDFKETVQKAVKYNLEGAQKFYDIYAMARDFEGLSNFISLMEDDNIVGEPFFEGVKVYGGMCRILQTVPKYSAGISMTRNNHIATYEYTGGENAYGFHQKTGTVFVYNSDLDQFGEAYWPTMDPYRMAGVTVDTTPLPKGHNSQRYTDNQTASGATDGKYGAIAYSYSGSAMDQKTRAKKSYFLFKDAIVQMGTDIKGETAATIETTIDSRMLNKDGSNRVLINGEEYMGETNVKDKISLPAGSWIHLTGNVEGADMAYYFPVATEIEIGKVLRSGRYDDINAVHKSDLYEQYYLTLGINHGTGVVENQEYYYVTLPSMTVDEVKVYAANNTLKEVTRDKNAHVIKDQNGSVLAVNYWGYEPYKTEWLTLEADKPATMSVLVTEEDGVYTMNIANPDYSASTLKVTSDYVLKEVLDKNEAIQVDGNSISVDTTHAGGHSFQISFTVEEDPNVVASVTLNKTETSIYADEIETLIATITPDSAVNKAVTWESSNEAVATVSSNGVVTGISAGETTITVTTVDGNKTADCKVSVVNNPDAVTAIALNKTETSIYVGKAETLIATIAPDSAVNKAVTWESSNEAVATVSSSGVVTGVSVGETTITVTTVDGNKTADCKVSVEDTLVISHTIKIITNGRGTVVSSVDSASVGETVTLTATPYRNWYFSSWEAISPSNLTITGNNFVMPGEDVTIKAIFKRNVSSDNSNDQSFSSDNDRVEKDTGKWSQIDGKWYFLDANGAMKTNWVMVDEKWYFLDANGVMKTDWVMVDEKWYFLDASGAMKTDWVKVNEKWYFLDASGAMKTGWVQVNEKWYYLYSDGSMAANTTIDGYELGTDGAAK